MDSRDQSGVGATDNKIKEAELELEEEEEGVDINKEYVIPARKRPRDRRSGANFLSRVLFM